MKTTIKQYLAGGAFKDKKLENVKITATVE